MIGPITSRIKDTVPNIRRPSSFFCDDNSISFDEEFERNVSMAPKKRNDLWDLNEFGNGFADKIDIDEEEAK